MLNLYYLPRCVPSLKYHIFFPQFERPKHTINLSPFPAKLETFLRINKIKYVPEFKYAMSEKGKSPWLVNDFTHITQECNFSIMQVINPSSPSHMMPFLKSILLPVDGTPCESDQGVWVLARLVFLVCVWFALCLCPE